MLSKEVYNNKDKILISLFFRRWRRNFKLFFIVPELLDIIIDFYYKKNENISLAIKNILNDINNKEIKLHIKNGENINEEKYINDIIEFVGEWYKIPEHNKALYLAINSTYEYLFSKK